MDKDTNEKNKKVSEQEEKVQGKKKKESVQNKNNKKKLNEKDKKTEKSLKMNAAKCIVIVLIVVIIAYLIIAFSKKDEELKPAPNITIDYNLLNVERSNGNIVMEDGINAEVKDGVKRNTSSKLLEEKTYNDMILKEARIEASGGMSQFAATVENPYDKSIQGEEVYVVFINEDGSELARIETFFPDLEPNSTSEISAGTDIDITTAYDFYIETK